MTFNNVMAEFSNGGGKIYSSISWFLSMGQAMHRVGIMLDQFFVVTVFVVTVMNWCIMLVMRGVVVIGTSA